MPFQEGAGSSWMSKSGMRKRGNQAPLLREASLQALGAGGREAACEQVSRKRQNHREGGEPQGGGALGSPCPGPVPSSGKESKAQSQRSRASPAIRNSPPIPAVTVLKDMTVHIGILFLPAFRSENQAMDLIHSLQCLEAAVGRRERLSSRWSSDPAGSGRHLSSSVDTEHLAPGHKSSVYSLCLRSNPSTCLFFDTWCFMHLSDQHLLEVLYVVDIYLSALE